MCEPKNAMSPPETARFAVRQHYPLSRTRANRSVVAVRIEDSPAGDRKDRKDLCRQDIGLTISWTRRASNRSLDLPVPVAPANSRVPISRIMPAWVG
jgi:hypothetical protein